MSELSKKRPSLLEALAKATAAQQEGLRAATLVSDHSAITPDGIAALQAHARVDKETHDLLLELEEAHGKIAVDPYARRDWLRRTIVEQSHSDALDAQTVIGLLFAAMKQTLPNGSQAVPLFKSIRREELRKWPVKMFLPVVSKDSLMLTRGVMIIVPLTPDDTEALQYLTAMRDRAAQNLVAKLKTELQCKVREIVWLALFMFERTSVWTKTALEEEFEQIDDGLVYRKMDKRINYRTFELSEKEIFLVEHSALSEELVRELYRVSDFMTDFFGGTGDISLEMAQDLVPDEMAITGREFLEGVPGYVAVKHDSWRLQDGSTASVLVVFARSDDNLWRWIIANRAGVDALFSGRRMAFHSWTRFAVPPHLVSLLRKCTVVSHTA